MDKRQISTLNSAFCVLAVLKQWQEKIPAAARDCQEEIEDLTGEIMDCGRQQMQEGWPPKRLKEWTV